jgi:DNA repair protein RadC
MTPQSISSDYRRINSPNAIGSRPRAQADIQMTKAIIDIATPLGISVHDHIIVGRGGHASLKGMRLI